jgi:thioester reductase-like protein
MTSILHALDARVKEQPDKLLYVFLDIKGVIKESYTYQEFYHRTNDIASHINTYQLKAGDRVLLAYPPGLEMVCSFFACVRLGLIPVPVYPPTVKDFDVSAQKMDFIAEDCEAAAVLTDSTYYWSVKVNLAKLGTDKTSLDTNRIGQLVWIISDEASTSGIQNFEAGYSNILFLQYTSGSTNNPKGVMVTHKNMLDNFENVVDHLPIGVSWLPQYHDMGLIGYYIFFALRGGTTYGFSPRNFILRPSLWLETISKYKGSATSAPNFAYEYCLSEGKISEEVLANLDLSSLRFTMNAAEPVNGDIFTKFIKKFEPYGLNPQSVFAAYGLAENTLAVSNYGRTQNTFDAELLREHKVKEADENTSELNRQIIMSCGRVLGDTEVKIVDVSGMPKEVENGNVGEIWITGTSKCLGYWNRAALTKEKFEAELPDNSDVKWLRSGDLGFMYKNELYVCGRLKDMIIIRGLNYYPHDIELLIEQEKNVRKGSVAAFSNYQNGVEKLVVMVGLRIIKKIPDAHEINAKIVHHFGISADTIVFVPARTISKTSSGKIKRYDNKKNYLNGELQILAQVEIVKEAVNATQEANSIEKITDYQLLFKRYHLTGNEVESLGDAGLDSLKLAEFAHDLKSYIKKKGYEDLSNDIDLRIIQKIAVSELYSILKDLDTSSALSKLKFQKAFQRIHQEYVKSEAELMKADATCKVSFNDLKVVSNDRKSDEAIFLTGGTGFFGPFLIKSLLEQNKGKIYVLVRAKDEAAALARLKGAFAYLDDAKEYQKEFDERVMAICGDLTKSRLGMSMEHWDYLCNAVNIVYHNGALVNYLLDYGAMRNANVGGTNEIIRLCTSSKTKVLNYISTTFIFGWSTKDTLFESDSNEGMELLDFGYSQSKWVSEHVVEDAMRKGLKARIFRPALISPSMSGDGYNVDISMRLMVFMVKYGIGTTSKNQVSYTPADIGANNIVAISNIEESIDKTFHVTRDEFSSMEDITTILSQLVGRSFDNYPLKDFVPKVVNQCSKQDLLFPLLNFLVRSVDNISAMEFKRYDNSNYVKYRNMSKYGIQDNSLEDVVKGIFRFMEKQSLI